MDSYINYLMTCQYGNVVDDDDDDNDDNDDVCMSYYNGPSYSYVSSVNLGIAKVGTRLTNQCLSNSRLSCDLTGHNSKHCGSDL